MRVPIFGVIVCTLLGMLSSRAGALPWPEAECFSWEPGSLAPQAGHAMAFDTVRGEILLRSDLRQIWARRGEEWVPLELNGAPIDRASAVFDSQRGVLVVVAETPCLPGIPLFTWEWDGADWALRAMDGPGVSLLFTLTYDSIRGVTVLSGGIKNDCSGNASQETWEWAGSAWSLRAFGGPSPRYGAASTFDSTRGVTAVFGRFQPLVGELRDTWEWNGTAWSLRATTGPSARQYAAMTYDESRQRCVLYGGVGPGMSNATWEWDGSSWVSFGGASPGTRSAHAMAYDPSQQKIVLMGGSTAIGALADTWQRVGTTWTRVSTGPQGRSGPAVAYDSNRNAVVMFGGDRGVGAGRINETWEWSDGVWTQRTVSGPAARTRAAMAFDRGRGVTVLFGGDVGGEIGDTWEFNGTLWSRRSTTGPTARVSPALAYDSARGVTVLYGGRPRSVGWFDDTWEWNGTTWTQRFETGPNMSSVTMCYDESRGVCVAYGNRAAQNVMEMWEYNAATGWTRPEAETPQLSNIGAIAYDRVLGACVLSGYVARPPQPVESQIWIWDGAAWTPRTPPVPLPARLDTPMCYVDSLGGVLVTSGANAGIGGALGDVWILGHEPAFTRPVGIESICDGGSVTLDPGAVAGPDPQFRWQRETTPKSGEFIDLVDGPTGKGSTIAGAATARLAVSSVTSFDEGRYRLVVTNSCGTRESPAITLAVCRTDLVCDGTIDKADVGEFIARWHNERKSGGLGADFNGDGVVNSTDVSDFINAWFQEQRGCGGSS